MRQYSARWKAVLNLWSMPRTLMWFRLEGSYRYSGRGRAANRTRHGSAIQRAQRTERFTRALSVAMPVLAYIWRYSFEMNRNASRDLRDFTQCERFQIDLKL